MRIDLHTHSNRSDGTDPVDVLIRHARQAGLDVIALTDHDTADGWPEARLAAEELGIGFVPGLEISCKLNGISVHLLSYLPDPSYPPLAKDLQIIRAGRNDRIPTIVARLNSIGVPLTVDEVLAQATGTPSVGRPHVADALVANGTVANRTEAFDRYLADGRAGHVAHYALEPGRAIDLVREAGGVPVIAHPWGRSSYKVMTEETIGRLVDDHGLAGIEVDHQDHSPESREALRAIARNLGIIYTGSSDHHGAGKIDHDLGVNSTEPEQLERLLEVAKTNAAASVGHVPEAYLP
ncbi:PHP domain-containing protein [Kribbella solani]|uniref:Putative metal-dependent phosphoesterase TrpH n=1 Tax=Kribbella solani TaxID=236067 RepID=A0A841E072_9ACTN|nr:PHP domain-containing protein [Kribbella solani]MBB5983621.1 putative metal-dependent phosphoesterase TrpH [Kribbella solani]MDX2969969.1 PHP domain-containing protein [Kribbella solani]MDX3002890.1 PHP domain-containing protein [Kribbella solani]